MPHSRTLLLMQAMLLSIVLGIAGSLLIYRTDHPGVHLVLGSSPAPMPSVEATPSPSPSPVDPCPVAYKAADPFRPVVSLQFTLSPDFSTVRGHEQITFVPDRPIHEIYLRLWPNAPISAANGSHMSVTSTSVQGVGVTPELSVSDTLARLPLPKMVVPPAAYAVTADFTFSLPRASNDRYGYQQGLAWWGTGFPLLPYEPHHGWDLEPPTSAYAETATSQDMQMTISVTAPNDAVEVVSTGVPGERMGATWTFTADAVRDVGIAIGTFSKAVGRSATGTPIYSYVAAGLQDSASAYVQDEIAAVNDHVQRLGPFPYPRLVSVTLPGVRGGIEYPGFIMYGIGQHNVTPSHEVAHQWFYALVGDDQARDPWLDEALATFIEALHRGTDYSGRLIPAYGVDKVGAAMTYWEPHTSDYFNSVYIQGALALLRARRAVGSTVFDTHLRCYVTSHAHDITTPADFAGAFLDLPQVLAILRKVGAF